MSLRTFIQKLNKVVNAASFTGLTKTLSHFAECYRGLDKTARKY